LHNNIFLWNFFCSLLLFTLPPSLLLPYSPLLVLLDVPIVVPILDYRRPLPCLLIQVLLYLYALPRCELLHVRGRVTTAGRVGVLRFCFVLVFVGGLVGVGGGWRVRTEKFVNRLEVVIDEHIVQVAVGEWVVRVSSCLPLFLPT